MINNFYTCLANRSATSLSQAIGADVVDLNFVPVVRHEAVERLATLVFTTDLDHSLMMFARAKQAIQSSSLQLLVDRTNLDQGYLADELVYYFWSVLTSPRGSDNHLFMHAGGITSHVYKVNRFQLVVEESEVVIYSSTGVEVDRRPRLAGAATSLQVVAGSETRLLVADDDSSTQITWASRPLLSLSKTLVGMKTDIYPLLEQLLEVESCLTKDTILSMIRGLNFSNSPNVLATVALLISAHTAVRAGVKL